MEFANFASALQWVLVHSYWLMFIAMLVEGPVVTAAAAFAVALGYFNLIIVFILALLGDLVADVIYYFIGYISRVAIVDKIGHRFGLTEARIKKIEHLAKQHSWKTMLVLKLTPFIPTPGLIIVGTTKMPLRKFTFYSLAITLPKTIIFMTVGYYFGRSYDLLSRYFKNGIIAIIIIAAVVFLIYYIYQKVTAALADRIEKI